MKIVEFESGQCRRVRSYLDSYLSNELMAETNLEVLQHLENCANCARELDDRARIKAQLKRVVLNVQAPDSLQKRIRGDIRRTQRFSFSLSPTWMLAAAAAVVIAVMLGLFFRAGTGIKPPKARPLSLVAAVEPGDVSKQILKVGFDDHVYCAIDHRMADKHFTPEQMSKSLGPQYEGLVALVKERLPKDFEIAVGHRCHYQNREFVHLIMRRQTEVVSLILTQKNGESFDSANATELLQGTGIGVHEASWYNLHVAGFETTNHLAFLISSDSASDNGELAKSILPAVDNFLKRITV
jgi:anti-sigma factor (TIGR02949 family)